MQPIFRNLIYSLIIVLLVSHCAVAQYTPCADSCTRTSHPFKYTRLIAPVLLIGVGIIGLESDGLKSYNLKIRNEIKEHIDKKISIDDFSQYAPMVAVYGLNLCNIKGRHNFRDRTVILATSYLIMGASVYGLKKLTRVERPDGSAFNSFPSGHTATAFMGAEFLRQEYKDVSPWYGIAGYAVATGTALFRMYNNRHWFTDVLSGAGIGILSTKIAYWVYPSMQSTFFKKSRLTRAMAAPYYNGESMGISFQASF